jgi:hypothetical protein
VIKQSANVFQKTFSQVTRQFFRYRSLMKRSTFPAPAPEEARLKEQSADLNTLSGGCRTSEPPPDIGRSAAPSSLGTIAGDILYGADGIAEFLYGDAKLRRKVYNLVETGRIPHFKLGAGLCARKSVLLSWIAAQERVEW